MNMFEINQRIGSTFVDISLDKQLNQLIGFSGEGKTYLFKLIYSYCIRNKISVTLITYQSFPAEEIPQEELNKLVLQRCENCSVILFDNADLYLTHEIILQVKKFAKVVIASIKYPYGVSGDLHRCKIKYVDNKITVRSYKI